MNKVYLILFLVLFGVGAFGATVKVLDYDPLPAQAGEFVDVFLSIENNQEATSAPIEIEVVPKDSLRLAFGQEAVKEVGLIFGNKSSIVKYKLEVTSDAVEGDNFFEVKVREEGERELSYDLSIDIENKTPLIELGQVTSEPTKVLPDTDGVKLSVTVLNIGDGLAENLKTTLSLASPLEFSESFSNLGLIGNLEPNTSGKVDFFIDVPKETLAGKYTAKLLVEYTLENSVDHEFLSKEISFDIVVKPVPKMKVVSAQTEPKVLSAGDRNVKLKLVFQNVGEADAESVRVKVFQKSEQPFEFDKTSDFVSPKLAPGESGEATLEFRVKDEANIQKYSLDIEVRSFVDDEVRLEDHVVEIAVANAAQESPNLLLLVGVALVAVLVVVVFYWRRLSSAQSTKAKK